MVRAWLEAFQARGSSWPPSRAASAIAEETVVDLHVRYRRRLEAVAFRLLHDQDEAEDVVQRVFEALPRVDFRGQASLWTYLYRAAVNGALTVLRKRRRDQREGQKRSHVPS